MRYDWRCSCGATTEVQRPMAESSVGPRHGCKACGRNDYKKVIAIPQRAMNARSEKSPFPLRLNHIEKPEFAKDRNGKIIGTHKVPIIAHNQAEYNEILNRRGLVCALDGEDPMVGISQRSVYDQFDNPAPSEHAEHMHREAFFTEDVASVGELL